MEQKTKNETLKYLYRAKNERTAVKWKQWCFILLKKVRCSNFFRWLHFSRAKLAKMSTLDVPDATKALPLRATCIGHVRYWLASGALFLNPILISVVIWIPSLPFFVSDISWNASQKKTIVFASLLSQTTHSLHPGDRSECLALPWKQTLANFLLHLPHFKVVLLCPRSHVSESLISVYRGAHFLHCLYDEVVPLFIKCYEERARKKSLTEHLHAFPGLS